MSAKWKGFSSTMRIKDAQQILHEKIGKMTEEEIISVFASFNRLLSRDITAPHSLPGFRRSAMDGYAVISSDTFGASETSPILLEIMGKVEIGDTEVLTLKPGSAIRISTGAPLPNEANAVIKIEDCEEIDESTLELHAAVAQGKNVANEDEDVKRGEIVFKKNHLVLPWDLAMIVSLGIENLHVYRKPRVAVLSTGSELIGISKDAQIGQVVDSNRPAIEIWCKHLGAEVFFSGTCEDEVDIISSNLKNLAGKADLIVTTGGTSVGTRDYMAEIIDEMGESWIKGVSIRPGKPVIIGLIDTTPIIALPGYPLAAFLNFDFFVVPILSRWTGVPSFWRSKTKVELSQSIASRSGIRDIVRLKKIGDKVEVLRITGAGILSSLTKADYLLEIPEDLEGYPEGSIVDVRRLRE